MWVRNLVSHTEEEPRMMAFENRLLRETLGPKRGGVKGEWRK
jgi:hypothetical protein